jgi:hypothetical protein
MLKRFPILMTVACITASAGLVVQSSRAADDVTVTHSNSSVTFNANAPDNAEAQLPAGIAAKNLNSDKAIEKSFQKLTNDALSKNSFGDVAAMLADQDYDRIKKSASNSLSNLNGDKNKALNDLVNNIDNTWRSKYNQKFDMDYSKVFTSDFIRLNTGEVSDPNLLVGNWPVDASALCSAEGGKVTPQDAQTAQNKVFGGRVKLEKGRNVAVAHLVASHGLPGINASLIHEVMSGWKFDIPNTIDAQRLYDNLVANLGYVNSHMDQLPSDVNGGYREVAHAVVAAIYDINLSSNNTAANRLDSGSPRPANSNTVNNR